MSRQIQNLNVNKKETAPQKSFRCVQKLLNSAKKNLYNLFLFHFILNATYLYKLYQNNKQTLVQLEFIKHYTTSYDR